ncbi:MAG: carboxypeptidase-like regulatory domain-containing protein [Planctomycetota bacterium]
MRSSSLLAIVAAAGIVLVAAGWWIAVMDEHRPTEHRVAPGSGSARDEDGASAPGPAEAHARSPARETVEVEVPAPTGATATAGGDRPVTDGRGTLHLTVVDALTAEPLAGLRLEVFSERPTSHVLARRATDAHGEATLTRLPEDVLLVETERRPPNCSALGAVWLASGASKHLVLRVGRGGTVRGRVINDRREPLAGVSVLVINAAGSIPSAWAPREKGELLQDPWVVSATTDASGRYQVGALIDRPRGVWVVNDAPRPERCEPVTIQVRSGALSDTRQVSLRESETKEVEDVVFPRAVELRGRVLDAEQHPVAGALVSASYRRATANRLWPSVRRDSLGHTWFGANDRQQLCAPPGKQEFTLLPEECLTEQDGEFVLHQETNLASCLVLTRDGILQQFPVPEIEPGGACEALVFKLEPQTVLELVITNELAERRPGEWPLLQAVTAITSTGDERCPVGDAIFFDSPHVLRFACLPSAIRALRLRAHGCEPLEYLADGKLENGQRIEVTLERRKRYELRLAIARDPADRAPLPPHGSLFLSACLASPEQREQKQHCCGLGADPSWVKLTDLPVQQVLEVKTTLPYWIYVQVPSTLTGWPKPLVFGPFLPGEEAHAIVLPPLEFEVQKSDERPKEVPREEVARLDAGSVALRAIDAKTHVALTRVALELRQAPEFEDGPGFTPRADADGLCLVPVVTPGSYRAIVSADGYDRAESPCVVEPGKRIDLGTFALMPQPQLEVSVVDCDGSVPDPQPFEVRLADGAHETEYYPRIRSNDGRYLFPGDIKAPFTITVLMRGATSCSMRFSRMPDERVIEVRLPRTYRVRVRVTGIPDEYREAYLDFEVRDANDHVARASASPATPADESAGIRTYEWRLAPGRYRLRGDSFVLTVPEREIEVSPSDAVQEIELVLR